LRRLVFDLDLRMGFVLGTTVQGGSICSSKPEKSALSACLLTDLPAATRRANLLPFARSDGLSSVEIYIERVRSSANSRSSRGVAARQSGAAL
jgi:hypothetical protein